jgi:glutamate transport system substrate-binding protein
MHIIRRIGAFAAVLAAVTLIAAGCGGGGKDKLKVGTKFDQPLFGLKSAGGDVQGFDAEIARLIAKEIGRDDVEFVEAVSKNREPFLQDGTVDMVIATYTINDERKQKVDFVGPYYIARQDIMVKKDNDTIKSVDDLNGKKVCSAKGSTSAKNVVAKAPQAQLIELDTYSLCAEQLRDGRVEAVSTDDAILLGLISQSPNDFKLVNAPFSEEPWGIGVKKGSDLKGKVEEALKKIIADGRWADAYKRTVGAYQPNTPPPPQVVPQ